MRTLNWILYEPIWKQCYFRSNVNEPLTLNHLEITTAKEVSLQADLLVFKY